MAAASGHGLLQREPPVVLHRSSIPGATADTVSHFVRLSLLHHMALIHTHLLSSLSPSLSKYSCLPYVCRESVFKRSARVSCGSVVCLPMVHRISFHFILPFLLLFIFFLYLSLHLLSFCDQKGSFAGDELFARLFFSSSLSFLPKRLRIRYMTSSQGNEKDTEELYEHMKRKEK